MFMQTRGILFLSAKNKKSIPFFVPKKLVMTSVKQKYDYWKMFRILSDDLRSRNDLSTT